MRQIGNRITKKLLLVLGTIATLATIASTANSSSNPKACPHVCITVNKGESKADAIKKFEKNNNCVVSSEKSCAKQDRIQYSVLEANENDNRPVALNGYVPKYKNGQTIDKSGVTIGYGVDLGQQDMATLKAWGVSKSLRDKLKPYLGKTKADAILYLYGDGTKKHPAHPLTITTSEAKELNDGARSYIIGKLATAFDNDNAQQVDFYQLPSGTQTALADFFYQHGAYSNKVYKKLWNAVKNLDWEKVAKLLPQEPGQPNKRLQHDAKLVKDDIKAIKFSNNGVPKC